ncbi:MAG: hypothetical protein ILO34_05320 [Kiritimatiellae bacterium]|nr:hypothetical protein [Kiritimatiellia bacterium]
MKYTFDSREVGPGDVFVALKGEKADGRDYIPQALAAGAAGVIEGLEALQQAARERRRRLKAKVIGVTGSAGKTTTKEFLKTFLACSGTEGNFNNHIGLPLTILNCPDDAEFLVLEMGTNHPGEIAALCDIAEPDVGVVCSIGTAHIEFFGSREAIAEEKLTLARRAKSFALVPEDASKVTPPFPCPLPGAHNLSNMSLAYQAALRLGATPEECAARLKGFSLPGSRWRRVEIDGVGYIDDSYNANPDSMIAALDAFAAEPCEGRRIAVLGDMFELGENALAYHRKVFSHALELGIPLVIGVGELSSQCICHLAYKTLEPLKKKFRADVSAGDLVLIKASHGMKLGELVPAR